MKYKLPTLDLHGIMHKEAELLVDVFIIDNKENLPVELPTEPEEWLKLNDMLTNYSIQVLIASDDMDKTNGSTEVVPFSHKIQNLDLKIHNKNIYNAF